MVTASAQDNFTTGVVGNTHLGSAESATSRLVGRDGQNKQIVMETRDLTVYYGQFCAVRDVTLSVARSEITAFIGPSGCGKSTILRSLNRMNDLIPSARVTGKVIYRGIDLYGTLADAGEGRRRTAVRHTGRDPDRRPRGFTDPHRGRPPGEEGCVLARV